MKKTERDKIRQITLQVVRLMRSGCIAPNRMERIVKQMYAPIRVPDELYADLRKNVNRGFAEGAIAGAVVSEFPIYLALVDQGPPVPSSDFLPARLTTEQEDLIG